VDFSLEVGEAEMTDMVSPFLSNTLSLTNFGDSDSSCTSEVSIPNPEWNTT
jgi:hypothetical protein